jgi:hypothetical protein
MAAQQFEVEVHGTKRPAEGELDDQPLAKKFGGLRIGMKQLPIIPKQPD